MYIYSTFLGVVVALSGFLACTAPDYTQTHTYTHTHTHTYTHTYTCTHTHTHTHTHTAPS